MKLTDAERLILVMLAEIHKYLGIRNGVDTKLVEDSIYKDHTWGLSFGLSGIVKGDCTQLPQEVHEVLDILSMWYFIEEGYDTFEPVEKAKIANDAAPCGKHVKFMGFDGNMESKHMSAAQFLVENLDRYPRFKGRNFNSHCPTLDTYKRMLAVFMPMQKTLNGNNLSVDHVIEILKAQHPQ